MIERIPAVTIEVLLPNKHPIACHEETLHAMIEPRRIVRLSKSCGINSVLRGEREACRWSANRVFLAARAKRVY